MDDDQPASANHAVELALLGLLATLWGASYTFIKLGIATVPPVTLIAVRTLVAGALLALVMRLQDLRMPRDTATWRRFLVQACLNSVIPFTLIAWAERSVDAGLATILNSTAPIFVFLLTVILSGREAMSARKLLGVVLGIAGTCLIIGVEALAGLGRDLVAQLAIVAATICYAGAAIFGRGFKGLHPMVPAAGSFDMRSAHPPAGEPRPRPALDPRAVGDLGARSSGARHLLHGACLGHLFPADPVTRLGRNDRAGLFARACRRRHRGDFSWRETAGDGLDRPLLRGGRRRGHDATPASAKPKLTVEASLVRPGHVIPPRAFQRSARTREGTVSLYLAPGNDGSPSWCPSEARSRNPKACSSSGAGFWRAAAPCPATAVRAARHGLVTASFRRSMLLY